MSRVAFTVNAVLAWLGVVLTVVISTVDGYARTAVEPGLYGGTPLGWPGAPLRFLDSLSYFTIWSNIVVAVSTTLLALQPAADTFWRRALRLSGLMMITITAIVYAVLLAPTTVVSGWSHITNPLTHVVVPAVTVLVWLIWGPRGWITWRTLPASLAVPVGWVLYMLLRGWLDGTYPYGFVNVGALGYAQVFSTIGGIFAFGLLIGAAFGSVDWLIRRAGAKPVQPSAMDPGDSGWTVAEARMLLAVGGPGRGTPLRGIMGHHDAGGKYVPGESEMAATLGTLMASGLAEAGPRGFHATPLGRQIAKQARGGMVNSPSTILGALAEVPRVEAVHEFTPGEYDDAAAARQGSPGRATPGR